MRPLGRSEIGDRCFGAFRGAELLSYCFFAFEDTAIDPHLRFRYPRGWIYAYKAFTCPEWRGKGLLPVILQEARGLGAQGLVTLAVTRNHASLRAFAKAGFQPLRDIRVVVLCAKPRKILHFDPRAGFNIEVA